MEPSLTDPRLLLAVALGGALGALGRYSIGVGLSSVGGDFPAGTFVVNVLGSFLIALILFSSWAASGMTEEVRLFLTVGILGAFTTMSTFSYESMKLLDDDNWLLFGVNVVGTVVVCLVAVALGKVTAEAVWGSVA